MNSNRSRMLLPDAARWLPQRLKRRRIANNNKVACAPINSTVSVTTTCEARLAGVMETILLKGRNRQLYRKGRPGHIGEFFVKLLPSIRDTALSA